MRFVAHDKGASHRSMNITGTFKSRALAAKAIGLEFAKQTLGLAERSRYFVSSALSWNRHALPPSRRK